MATYLMTWNPNDVGYGSYLDDIGVTDVGGTVRARWRITIGQPVFGTTTRPSSTESAMTPDSSPPAASLTRGSLRGRIGIPSESVRSRTQPWNGTESSQRSCRRPLSRLGFPTFPGTTCARLASRSPGRKTSSCRSRGPTTSTASPLPPRGSSAGTRLGEPTRSVRFGGADERIKIPPRGANLFLTAAPWIARPERWLDD